VLVFRCTRKLLTRLKLRGETDLQRSSTQLGDWYANTLNVGRLRLVIFISENAMLPVVVPQRESKTLVPRFRRALGDVLTALDMPEAVVAKEIDVDGDVAFGPTANRSVVGVMNDLAFMAEAELRSGKSSSLLEVSLWLSGVPIGPLEHVFPDEAVRLRLAPTLPKRSRSDRWR